MNHCKVFLETILGCDYYYPCFIYEKTLPKHREVKKFSEGHTVSGDLAQLFLELIGQEKGSISQTALGIHYNACDPLLPDIHTAILTHVAENIHISSFLSVDYGQSNSIPALQSPSVGMSIYRSMISA